MGLQHLFIIGAPRSGTTWLQIMIGSHSRVATTVELTLFSHYIAPLIKGWEIEKENIDKGRWEQGLPFIWSQSEFNDFLKLFIEKVYDKVHAKNPFATHILDKHPGYSKYVKLIQSHLPEAKFIHMIRDGRDVAASMISARNNMGFGEGTIEGAAREWKENVLASKIISDDKEKYFEIRYEDMLNDTFNSLKKIFTFCKLDINNEELNEIIETNKFENLKIRGATADPNSKLNHSKHYRKGKAGSWKDDLSIQEQFIFNEVAGSLLIDLGYEDDHEWIIQSPANKLFLKLNIALNEKIKKIKLYAPKAMKAITHW